VKKEREGGRGGEEKKKRKILQKWMLYFLLPREVSYFILAKTL